MRFGYPTTAIGPGGPKSTRGSRGGPASTDATTMGAAPSSLSTACFFSQPHELASSARIASLRITSAATHAARVGLRLRQAALLLDERAVCRRHARILAERVENAERRLRVVLRAVRLFE